ncbi:MAG TPA: uroporphyrinogen-III C-methyltransferase [Kofleriaceae bacterium]|jgi:uroporphyrin-III C-methyltransferase/precorrin-2 dehydrogenase/sirohydrochlorin ferrochelatase
MSATGFVSLVGAGPGDPELLTLRAVDRLRHADLVLYDALVDPHSASRRDGARPGEAGSFAADLLELAPRARRFYVGKRAGRHSIDQEGIHRLMIRAAKRGARVVRLKCGDPFVLGRGGEEALALEAAGIAYEVVPGLSSAIAAPALAGIPVTHRGAAAGFAVVSGHAASSFGPAVDSIAPGALTLVVLMGLRTRGELAARLIARGWASETPAAIVLGASHEGEARWIGTIGGLGAAEIETELPGVIVVGEVVRMAEKIGQGHGRGHEHGQDHEQEARQV